MSVKQRNVTIERGVKISGGPPGGLSVNDADFAKQAGQVIRDINGKRELEKQELQVLNQRFSSYVERVRALEAMNRKLLADIDDLKSKWGFDSSKIKDQMEPELLKFRELIDEITRLKAVAEIKAKRAESDALQFKHLMDLAMDSFNTDKNKIMNLERLLDNTQQDGLYLKNQLNDLNEQIAKYVDEQRRLSEQLRQIKDDLDKETIDRVTRQNEVQTLEEQIAFLKAVHEQEVSELSRLQTIVGFDPAQFYRTELERAIRDIRCDFEQLNHEQKRELEEWYRIKTEEVEKEVAKQHQQVSTIGLSSIDMTDLKQAHLESQREFIELQRRHSELMAKLRELEERLEQTKSNNQIHLAERDRDLSLLRDKIQEIMASYDELMNRKTSLEFEINTYRRLLECEETRLNTPSRVPSAVISATTHHSYSSYSSSSASSSKSPSGTGLNQGPTISVGGGGGSGAPGTIGVNIGGATTGVPQPARPAPPRDRDRDDTISSVINNIIKPQPSAAEPQPSAQTSHLPSSQPTVVDPNSTGASRSSYTQRGSSTELSSETITKRMQVQRTSKGPVGIKEISPDGKFVLIENTGKRGDQDISKWQIKRKVDNEPDIIFSFPLNTIIGSGRTIKIWSRGQGRANPPHEYVHEIEWRTGDSMVTRLISDSGEERALYSQRSSQ